VTRSIPSRANPGLSQLIEDLLSDTVDLPDGTEAGTVGDWLGRSFVMFLMNSATQELEGQFDHEETQDLAAAMVRVFTSGYATAMRGLSVGGAHGNGTG